MPDDWLKAKARENCGLFEQICEFNLRPARYMDPSWLEDMPLPDTMDMIRNSRRGEKKLSRYMLDRLELSDLFFFDFSDRATRIALVRPDKLHTLVRYTGAALHHERIRRMIQKSEVTQLKSEIGKEAYRFTTTLAPLLAGRRRFSFLTDPASDMDCTFFTGCGLQCLGAAFAGAPEPLTKRLRIKLPKTMDIRFHRDLPEGEKTDAGSLMIKIFLQEVDPTWAPLFT